MGEAICNSYRQFQRPDNFNAIQMINDMVGWISADFGAILYTEDGGESWVNQTTGITRHLHDIFFISPTKGWSVGTAGNILATDDGGMTWTKQESGSSLQLYAVKFKDENNGIVVGERGTVLVTDNGGSTWIPEASGSGEGLHDVYIGQSISFITGDAGLILTRGGPTVSSFPTDLVPVITIIIVLGITPLAILRRINRKRV
ncbi:MAG: WD40/YVTN/BNR-like repeat-containing protein [Promethearchaeota archaeon]